MVRPRREGWAVNRKRVDRLYRLKGLQLRKRKAPQTHVSAPQASTLGNAHA